MARISNAQREKNFTFFNALILEIFLTEGWEHITYSRLSKETGLNKSTLQGYYPSNDHFEIALNGKLFPVLLDLLDFSSKDKLMTTGKEAMHIHHFKMIMRLFLMHACAKGPESKGRVWVLSLTELISRRMPNEDALEITQLLLGLAATELLSIDHSYLPDST